MLSFSQLALKNVARSRAQETNYMNTNELCEKVLTSCAGGMSALRAVVKLVPAGGDGDKVSPPTHEGGKYAFEERVVDGRSDVKTVLLDYNKAPVGRVY